jgi:hypothetical protein
MKSWKQKMREYIELTGQTEIYVFREKKKFGIKKIKELVDQCLAENKAIIWTKLIIDDLLPSSLPNLLPQPQEQVLVVRKPDGTTHVVQLSNSEVLMRVSNKLPTDLRWKFEVMDSDKAHELPLLDANFSTPANASDIAMGYILQPVDIFPKLFNIFFEEAVKYGALGPFKSSAVKELECQLYRDFYFDDFLLETGRDEELKNKNKCKTWLTKSLFIEFLKYQVNKATQVIEMQQQEKQSWDLNVDLSPIKIANENLKGPDSQNFSSTDPLELIEPDRHGVFFIYETNVAAKVKLWKKKKDKIGCAVFCILLYGKKIFKPNKLKTAKIFSLMRYDNNTNAMIDKVRKTVNKDKFEKQKEKMLRLMLQKLYGKI